MWLSDEQKYLKLCLFLLIRRIFKVESQKHYQNWNEFLSLRASLILTFKFLLTYSVNYAKYPNEFVRCLNTSNLLTSRVVLRYFVLN
jgi:hypothetical protein